MASSTSRPSHWSLRACACDLTQAAKTHNPGEKAVAAISLLLMVCTLVLGWMTYRQFGWRVYSKLATDLRIKNAEERRRVAVKGKKRQIEIETNGGGVKTEAQFENFAHSKRMRKKKVKERRKTEA